MEWLSRTELLVGKEGIEKLQKAHVLIAGVGGVGSFAAEMVTRAGVGTITIVDADTVKASNRNRQLPALLSTEGQTKVEVMAARLMDINPELQLNIYSTFLKDETIPEILDFKPDYVIDAIDSLAPKVFLIVNCKRIGIPII